jgi:microcystin degradation protein MlrC
MGRSAWVPAFAGTTQWVGLMLGYLLRRVLAAIPVMGVVALFVFLLLRLTPGDPAASGPYYGGRDMDMGASACLRIDDVRVVVSSHKAQLTDRSMFRYVGIEPTEQSILVNKSSVHFRADFEPIAEKLLICAAPGAMPADTAALPRTNLRPGIRIKPNGPAFVTSVKSRSNSPAIG